MRPRKMRTPILFNCFNNRITVITLLGLATLFQQSICNGFPLVILRTLEIRYKLDSSKIGLITTVYEIADTAFCVILIYFLKNVRKPISLGLGFLVAAVGGVVFCLPHFIDGPYVVDQSDDCHDSNLIGNSTCQSININHQSNLPLILFLLAWLNKRFFFITNFRKVIIKTHQKGVDFEAFFDETLKFHRFSSFLRAFGPKFIIFPPEVPSGSSVFCATMIPR